MVYAVMVYEVKGRWCRRARGRGIGRVQREGDRKRERKERDRGRVLRANTSLKG